MSFKNRLKELRSELDITQRDLADKINSSKSKVSMWESGQRDPSTDDLLLISNIFDVSVDYLLGKTEIRKYSDSIIAFNTLDTEGLDDQEIEFVRSVIETMKAKHKK